LNGKSSKGIRSTQGSKRSEEQYLTDPIVLNVSFYCLIYRTIHILFDFSRNLIIILKFRQDTSSSESESEEVVKKSMNFSDVKVYKYHVAEPNIFFLPLHFESFHPFFLVLEPVS